MVRYTMKQQCFLYLACQQTLVKKTKSEVLFCSKMYCCLQWQHTSRILHIDKFRPVYNETTYYNINVGKRAIIFYLGCGQSTCEKQKKRQNLNLCITLVSKHIGTHYAPTLLAPWVSNTQTNQCYCKTNASKLQQDEKLFLHRMRLPSSYILSSYIQEVKFKNHYNAQNCTKITSQRT